MNTFLPYESYWRSARCLDNRRLGKQRVEVLQILRCLKGLTTGWRNHPAVAMWRGYESSLVYYGYEVCSEWIRRGFRDTCMAKIQDFDDVHEVTPPWIGGDIHASHRSNLLRKDRAWYSQFHWVEPDNLPYFWPTKCNTNYTT